jgi:hypothetical protein
MNSAINYASFIDMLITSDEEYEPYGIAPYSIVPVSFHAQDDNTELCSPKGSEEPRTWYGE